jgi:hypothetical protein
MNILCALFGHHVPVFNPTGSEYVGVTYFATDGIGRQHAHLWAICPRCGTRYQLGSIHIPKIEERKNV